MNTKHLLLGILFLACAPLWSHADPIEDGRTIFMTRCAACHNVNKKLTGPALAGIDQRRSIEWITSFVHSSQTLVKSGDKDAVSIYEEYNKVAMPDHTDLTDENIKSIIEFIKSEASSSASKGPFVKPSKLQTAYMPLSVTKDYGVFLIYFAVVGLFIAILLFAVRLKSLSASSD